MTRTIFGGGRVIDALSNYVLGILTYIVLCTLEMSHRFMEQIED